MKEQQSSGKRSIGDYSPHYLTVHPANPDIYCLCTELLRVLTYSLRDGISNSIISIRAVRQLSAALCTSNSDNNNHSNSNSNNNSNSNTNSNSNSNSNSSSSSNNNNNRNRNSSSSSSNSNIYSYSYSNSNSNSNSVKEQQSSGKRSIGDYSPHYLTVHPANPDIYCLCTELLRVLTYSLRDGISNSIISIRAVRQLSAALCTAQGLPLSPPFVIACLHLPSFSFIWF